MGKIFCLMGKSNSGKDTIFKELIKNISLGLNGIVTYTTRPIRSNETNGIEYHFITETQLEEYRKNGKVIEERVYETVKGTWYYITMNDGQIDLSKNNYLLITTLKAYKEISEFYGKDNVVPFYIDLDDGIRLERALKREKEQDNPHYDELCRRFLADNIDFSLENLNLYNIKKYYKNENLKDCVENLKNDIIKLR